MSALSRTMLIQVRELTSVSSTLGIVLYQWLFSPAMLEDLGKTEGSNPVRFCSTREEAFISFAFMMCATAFQLVSQDSTRVSRQLESKPPVIPHEQGRGMAFPWISLACHTQLRARNTQHRAFVQIKRNCLGASGSETKASGLAGENWEKAEHMTIANSICDPRDMIYPKPRGTWVWPFSSEKIAKRERQNSLIERRSQCMQPAHLSADCACFANKQHKSLVNYQP